MTDTKSVIQYILEYYFSNILNAPPSLRFISLCRAFPNLLLGCRTGNRLHSQLLGFSNMGNKEISVSTDWQHTNPLPSVAVLALVGSALHPHLPLTNRTPLLLFALPVLKKLRGCPSESACSFWFFYLNNERNQYLINTL